MTSPAPLGASLMTAAPPFSIVDAAQVLRAHFGIEGQISPLPSERDVNYQIASPGGRYVLKLANPAEPLAVTQFQTQALLHLEPANLAVPQVQRSLHGEPLVRVPQGVVRLLTFVEGRPQAQTPSGPELRRSLGDLAGRLCLALQGFDHPGADHKLQWDIRHAADLRPLLTGLDDDIRPVCAAALDRFETDIAPQLSGFRWQAVHNDLNPHNILVSADGRSAVGILDFGDMVRTALICDLAIAASYQVDPACPQTSLIDLAGAFHARLPLTAPEARALIGLVEARWLTTLCISAERARRSPHNAAYILRNAPQARAGLRALAAMDRGRATDTLFTALRLP